MTFQFDPTAALPANLITNEDIPLLPIAPSGALFVMPVNAPFFKKDLQIAHVSPLGVTRQLYEGVDYALGMRYFGGGRATQKPVYGCIDLFDRTLSGSIRFIQYRTMGSVFVQTHSKQLEILQTLLANPRIAAWEQVANIPANLPPAPHPWEAQDTVGMSDVVDAIHALTSAIGFKNNSNQVGGVVLSSPDSNLTAGLSAAHVAVVSSQYVLAMSLSAGVASSLGDVWVMPKLNGVAMLSTPIVLPEGLDYVTVADATITIRNIDPGQIIKFEVIAGHAGAGVRALTAYLTSQARV